jgi:hypothetical protein
MRNKAKESQKEIGDRVMLEVSNMTLGEAHNYVNKLLVSKGHDKTTGVLYKKIAKLVEKEPMDIVAAAAVAVTIQALALYLAYLDVSINSKK